MEYNSVINENFLIDTKNMLDTCKISNILEIIDILKPKDIILGKRKGNIIENINFEKTNRNYFDSARIFLDDYTILEYGKLKDLNVNLIYKKSIEDYISELEEILVIRPLNEGNDTKFYNIIELLMGKKISELESLKTVNKYINENFSKKIYFFEEFFVNNSIVNLVCCSSGLCNNSISPITEETHTSDIILNSNFDVVFYSKSFISEDIKEKLKKKIAGKIYKTIDKTFRNFSRCSIIIKKEKRLKCKIEQINNLINFNRKLYKFFHSEKRKEQIANKVKELEIRKNKYNYSLQKLINPNIIVNKNLKNLD